MADLGARLNAAIQEARLQVEMSNRQAEHLRWKEHLWVLTTCRDEITRLSTAPKRETLHLKAWANG